ncbi:hypothetical protein SAMN05443144_11927 [Fodinibius roseus]|uniref:Uncharacterized protein n=1 Tax=Fodinibius roseus TaxID=1194090 RepID=A0A1M5H3U6_9BACT|nr:hypothetical protein SAMN05443144_11927 [Fodinibius roseus]
MKVKYFLFKMTFHYPVFSTQSSNGRAGKKNLFG